MPPRAACHPRLSTVVVDGMGIGRTPGELLLRATESARNGRPVIPETVLIPYRIELRGSTRVLQGHVRGHRFAR